METGSRYIISCQYYYCIVNDWHAKKRNSNFLATPPKMLSLLFILALLLCFFLCFPITIIIIVTSASSCCTTLKRKQQHQLVFRDVISCPFPTFLTVLKSQNDNQETCLLLLVTNKNFSLFKDFTEKYAVHCTDS